MANALRFPDREATSCLPRAAGGIVWRRGAGGVDIVLGLARTGRWALPSGPVRSSDGPLASAIMAVERLTGLTCWPDELVGSGIDAAPVGGPRASTYWLMRPLHGRLRPGGDFDTVRWAPLTLARTLLGSAAGRSVLELAAPDRLASRTTV